MTPELTDFVTQTPTCETAARWQDVAAAAGLIPSDQARLRKTALAQLTRVREPTEPSDAAWMRDNADELARRLIASGVEKSTAGTYKSRVTSALRDFLEFRAKPEEFRTSQRGRGKVKSQPRLAANFSAFPLEGGRLFRYELPPRFTRRDLERLYTHLTALVEDFDVSGAARKPVQLPLSASIAQEPSADSQGRG